MLAFRVLYEDDTLLAVDKPAGFHSHPPEDPSLRVEPRWNGLRILERQFQRRVFPLHRLDRATSGILLCSLERNENNRFQQLFRGREIRKTYLCLVRGKFTGSTTIERPLKTPASEAEAITRAEALGSFTLPIPDPSGEARHFTFLKATPLTGRYHQIRRHMAGLSFPLVGDTRHGDRKLNREFAAVTGIDAFFLRCMRLEFEDPRSGRPVRIRAPYTRTWHKAFDRAGFCPLL